MTQTKNNQHDPAINESTEAILESISDGVFTVNADWRITSFNRAAEVITGISRQEALGRLCADVFRSSMCENDCALGRTLKSGRPVINQTGFIIDAQGRKIPISVSTAVLRDRSGRVQGGAETFRDLSELEELRRELEGRCTLGDLISRSPAMRQIFDVAPAVAASSSTVLIQGETGTGKELLARALHNLSPRAAQPFVAINCAAVPDTLLESELFGFKAGAFTGAQRDKPGRFALAGEGTLFLDEIGEMTPTIQVKLLRVLQEHVYEPLGSTRSEKTNARIIVATNRDLAAQVREGAFREDLFYRINIIRLDLPPLRERKEDIPLLVDHFIERFNATQHKDISSPGPETMGLLMAHNWPGNVRELENVIERAFILCTGGRLGVKHLPEELTLRRVRLPAGGMRVGKHVAEEQLIRHALEKNQFNRLAAARELGIHKSTLFRRMKALGIHPPRRDGRSRQP